MKVMMMEVFIGNLIKDLKAGKVDEVIAGLEKALANLVPDRQGCTHDTSSNAAVCDCGKDLTK